MLIEDKYVLKNKAEQYPVDEIIDKDQRMVRSWMSVEVKDKQGEIIPISKLKKTMNTWMKRGGVISDQHSNRMIGRGLNWSEKVHEKSGKPGIILDYQVYNDYTIDDEVWDQIKSGEREGLSFGGRATGKSKLVKDEDGEGMATELGDVEGYEIASVFEPANQLAQTIAVNHLAKSYDRKSETIKLLKDLEKGYASRDINKPLAGFNDFSECQREQKERGHTEESSDRICGWLQSRTEKKKKTDSVGKIDRDELEGFLSENPNPKDSEVHAWAESKGYEVDDVEEAIYQIASSKNKDKEKQEVNLQELSEKVGFKGDIKEFEMGMNVESEHKDVTNGDPVMTARIAVTHLNENPRYYTEGHEKGLFSSDEIGKQETEDPKADEPKPPETEPEPKEEDVGNDSDYEITINNVKGKFVVDVFDTNINDEEESFVESKELNSFDEASVYMGSYYNGEASSPEQEEKPSEEEPTQSSEDSIRQILERYQKVHNKSLLKIRKLTLLKDLNDIEKSVLKLNYQDLNKSCNKIIKLLQ